MIGLPTGTEIWIAAGVTDLRRGFTGLSAIVQTVLDQNPFICVRQEYVAADQESVA
jgi:transposase